MTWGNQNTEAEGHEQMDYALEQGVNFFDTAELYPVPATAETYAETERIIGTWFKKSGNRDKVVLASKLQVRAIIQRILEQMVSSQKPSKMQWKKVCSVCKQII